MNLICSRLPLVVIGCGALLVPNVARSADGSAAAQQTAANVAPAPSVTEAEKAEAKAIFAGQCGWCHGNYGMTADKGPKLAGTQMTEQEVEQRIRNGKPGYMPSFKKFLNDQQIALMAKYIKSLKPED
jgi:mono/diheme cytochrome c family protein